MSEAWLVDNMYCVHCGGDFSRKKNNNPAGDVFCVSCGYEYELKSSSGSFAKKITDGSYHVIIEKISSGQAPSFFCLSYSLETYMVKDLVVIPKHFLMEEHIEKRRPLNPTARRHDWTGCIINYAAIPENGKLPVIKNYIAADKNTVIKQFNSLAFIQNIDSKARGWILDIANIIEKIDKPEITLEEIYSFENFLKLKHPDNNNIKAKIRQQLQFLRNRGYLSFSGRGVYKIN